MLFLLLPFTKGDAVHVHAGQSRLRKMPRHDQRAQQPQNEGVHQSSTYAITSLQRSKADQGRLDLAQHSAIQPSQLLFEELMI